MKIKIDPNKVDEVEKECRQLGIKVKGKEKDSLRIEGVSRETSELLKKLNGVRGFDREGEPYSECLQAY